MFGELIKRKIIDIDKLSLEREYYTNKLKIYTESISTIEQNNNYLKKLIKKSKKRHKKAMALIIKEKYVESG
jgi:hypothetical protein